MSTPLTSIDPKDILNAASCFVSCVPTGYNDPLKSYLLTNAAGEATGPCVTPSAPTIVSFGSPTDTTLTLVWVQSANVGSIIFSYTVKLGTAPGGPYTITRTTRVGTKHLVITGLTAGTTYYAVVVANSFSGCSSANSAELSATTSGSAPFDARTLDWEARVIANGGADPSNATLTALNTFYLALDAASIYTKMVYGLFFPADNLIAAITPWVRYASQAVAGSDPATNHNFVVGDLSVNGLKGNGTTKYLDSGDQPGNWGGVLIPGDPLTNCGMTLYMPDLAGTSANNFIECGRIDTSDSSGNIGLFPAIGGTAAWECSGSATGAVLVATNDKSGYYSGNRIAGNDSRLFFANSSTAHAQFGATAAGVPNSPKNGPIYLFAANNLVAPNPNFVSSRTISFFAAHQGLTTAESLSFYNAVQALRTALGGGFV